MGETGDMAAWVGSEACGISFPTWARAASQLLPFCNGDLRCVYGIYIYIYKVSVCVCVSLFGRAIFVSSMPTHTHYLLTGPPSFCFI